MEKEVTNKINMKKIFIALLVLISVQSFGQKQKCVERLNANLTIDSFYYKQDIVSDSLFAYSNDAFIDFRPSYYVQRNLLMPEAFSNFHLGADNIYRNFTPKSQVVDWTGVNNKPLTFSPDAHNHAMGEITGLVALGNSKADINSPTFTGTVSGITKSMVGLANVDNTSDANKPISSATQTVLNNKSAIYVGLDAGANDSYVVTTSPAPAAYVQGMVVMFRANTQNTTGCTINVNGLGVKTIVKRVSTTPATADILALMWCWLIYDGANFVLLNPVVN